MADLRDTLKPLARLDWAAFAATYTLLAVGVVFIHSAGFGRDSTQWIKQIFFILLGTPLYFGLALFDYRRLREWVPLIYTGSLALLVGVLIFGKVINNSRSWFDLGFFLFQPSELAKIGLIVSISAFVGDPLRSIRAPGTLIAAICLTIPLFGLIIVQPDLGTAFILPCILLGILFAAGMPWRVIFALLLVGLLLIPLGWSLAKPYQKERILVFLDPDRDPLNAGWNMVQSRMAVGSGGLGGKGLRNGTQNMLGFLPTTVAPTDFIFSVITEEKGFIGSALVISLYSVLFVCLSRGALRASDPFGRYMSVGILCMIFIHTTINVAMTIGLMPIVGLPLPLVSYGGSFVLSMMLALGLAQSVHVRRNP